ncbi:MAG TPA: phosphoribosyl-ATP diphosphatase [Caulobacteraceae bacterium]|nr:phosphoribosyl-ATP diphosphatase [Caulobacteraceae bacterium]
MSRLGEVLERLCGVIEDRRGADPKRSWSARLLADPTLAAKKLAEEALETSLAAVRREKPSLVSESADLLYHWLVVLRANEVSLDEVAAALEAREGRSGLTEKTARKGARKR